MPKPHVVGFANRAASNDKYEVMKIFRILFAIALMCIGLAAEARTAADFFLEAPSAVFPSLDNNTRLDMLDYFRYGSDRAMKNELGGESLVLFESNKVLRVQVSERVQVDVAALAAGNDTILAVITTVSMPARDSSLAFYDREWRQLKQAPVEVPQYTRWLTRKGLDNVDELRMALPFIMASASIDDEATKLTFTNNAVAYLVSDEYEAVKDMLVDEIVYDIVKNKFKPRR